MANRQRRRGTMPTTNLRTVPGPRNTRVVEKIAASEPTFPNRVPARPAKLSADAEKRLLDCVRAGNHMTVCSRFVGLSPKTTEDWLRRGRGHDERPATAEYVRFVRLVEEARAAPEVLVVGNLVARSARDTRAAEVWLRSDPERARRWPKDGAEFIDVPGSGPAVPPANVTYDQRRQVAYVMIGRDEVDGIVGGLIESGQRERAARLAANVIEEDERPVDGTRIARLDGLRSDEGRNPDEDD